MSFSDKLSKMSPEQKKLLSQKILAGRGKKNLVKDRIKAIDCADAYPLSNAQRRLWVIDQLDGGSEAYNMSGAYVLLGNLDEGAFSSAIKGLITRHESLHTQIEELDGEPVQVVLSPETIDFNIIHKDWSNIDDVDERIEAIQLEESKKPFDLSCAPFLRVQLIHLAAQKRVLIITMHHIVSDGWSMGVLMRDVARLYEGFLSGKQDATEILNPLRIHYKDYSAWQNDRLDGERGEKLLTYWKEKLNDGAIEYLDIPTDQPRGKNRTFNGGSASKSFSREQLDQLKNLAQEEGCTLFMVLMAVTKVLLRRYSNQSEITVGTGIAGRDHVDLIDQIGFYVNTLVLHDEISIKSSFKEVLSQVKETMIGAYEHGEYPFDSLVDQLGSVERDMSRNPLFDVMVMMGEQWTENTGGSAQGTGLKGVELIQLERQETIAKFDWTFTFSETEGDLSLSLEYNSDLYESWRMEAFLDHFKALLDQVTLRPEKKIRDYELVTFEVENSLPVDYPKSKPINQLFEEVAKQYPDRVALVVGSNIVSYAALNQRANQLAHFLRRDYKISTESVVGIRSDKSLNFIVAVLAVLKSGGAYLPIDPSYPTSRQEYMLNDAQSDLLLSVTQDSLISEKLENYSGARLDLSSIDISQESIKNVETAVYSDNIAYVIYTSGSTGQPKGVGALHRNVSNLILVANYVKLSRETSMVLNSSISFDASTFEIWGTLLYGGKLIIPQENEFNASLFIHEQINTGWLTAGLFNVIITDDLHSLRSIRQLLIGGEALSKRHVELFQKLLPDTILVNGYGPTETTTFACCGEIYTSDSKRTSIPFGKALNNTTLSIDVSCGELESGELMISGDGLSRGYLHQPGLTAEKFIPSSMDSGVLSYKSGDICRYLDDGRIEYLGRKDNQIKLRGFRIELEEVQRRLEACAGVEHAIVTVFDKTDAEQILCAYWVGQNSSDEEILSELCQSLPSYMIPQYLEKIETIPLTINGKIDLKSLPKPQWQEGATEYEAPQGEVEEKLASLWCEMLQQKKVGRLDSFFTLGGNSLSAIKLVSQIKQTLEIEISLSLVFAHLRLKDLAEQITLANSSLFIEIEKVAESETYPLSNAQRRLWVIDQLDGGSEAYNMSGAYELLGDLDEEAFSSAINALIARHESLRTQIEEQDGEPVQVVLSPETIDFNIIHKDWSNIDDVDERLEAFQLEESKKPFDLSCAPFLRVQLIHLASEKHVLIFTMHHIVSDGWSMGVLMRDVAQLYEGFLSGKQYATEILNPLRIHYKDYSAWQNDRLDGERGEKLLTYWKEKLNDGAIEYLDIPTDQPRGKNRTFNGGSASKSFSREQLDQLKNLAQEADCTLFMVLMAVTKVLLRRYSNQSEITVGTAIAGRAHVDLKDQIGFYVNTLVLHDEISIKSNFNEVLAQVKETMVGAYEHAEYPFDYLVEQLGSVERDIRRNPLFDVMVMMGERWSKKSGDLAPESGLKGIELRALERESIISKFDWTFTFNEVEEGLRLDIVYNSDLYEIWRMDALLGHFLVLLNQIVDRSKKKIRDYELLGRKEKFQIDSWSQTKANYPKDKLVHQLFEEQVLVNPNKIALVCGVNQISYEELNRRSNQLAHYLRREHGVKPESLVAICGDHSIEIIIAILGILKAGGAYVPIDIEYPQNRRDFMLSDSNIKLVLTTKSSEQNLATDKRVFLEITTDLYQKECIQNPHVEVCPENLIYVIYTSGSTGQPKGSEISHLNFTNTLYEFKEKVTQGSEIRSLLITSLGFDLSQKNVFLPFMNGATLVLDHGGELEPLRILNECIKESVTWLNCTPSIFEMLVKEENFESSLARFRSLEFVILGGEILNTTQINFFIGVIPNRTILVNSYGPAECADVCIYSQIVIESSDSISQSVPIGKPCANVSIEIVDASGKICPIGFMGNLSIQGNVVGRGYTCKPRLSAEKFTPYIKGGRIYATGDLCYLDKSGEMSYVTRLDGLVKINGVRVELSEVEFKIRALNEIEDVVVIARKQNNYNTIIAYIVLRNKNQEIEKIRCDLSLELSVQMIPTLIVIEEIPLTQNGKIDKKTLISKECLIDKESYEMPQGHTERELAEIWETMLEIKKIGRNDNFFKLGGNSLAVLELVLLIRKKLHVVIDAASVWSSASLSGLAKLVEADYPHAHEDQFLGIKNKTTVLRKNVCISSKKSEAALQPHKLTGVFLTGATGFWGLRVLVRLVHMKIKVYCLVRSRKSEMKLKKVLKNIWTTNQFNHDLLIKIKFIIGDLSNDKIFEDQKDEYVIRKDTSDIILAAANVNHLMPYSELCRENVTSTDVILNKCNHDASARVHYISTISAHQNNELGDLQLDHSNGYVASKLQGEAIISNYVKNGFDCKIYRLGNLFPDYLCGSMNINNITFSFFEYCCKIKCIPDLKKIEFEAMDCMDSVDVFFHAMEDNNNGHEFNIYNDSSSSSLEIYESLKIKDRGFRFCGIDEWMNLAKKTKAPESDYICNYIEYMQLNPPQGTKLKSTKNYYACIKESMDMFHKSSNRVITEPFI